jgi:4-amino-4-deoxy-L-arabinose transferase-like glycosyltransferase
MSEGERNMQSAARRRVGAWLLALNDFLAGRALSGRTCTAFVVAISCGAFLLLFRLGAVEVCTFNEGVEAVAVQQMVEQGRLLFPQLNEREPVYKPPLFHWTATALEFLLGMHEVTEFTLRLPSALYALGSVFITMLFVRRRYGLHGAILSGLLLLASYSFLSKGRLGRVDMTLAFFETLALFAFLAWLSERSNDGPSSAPHVGLVGRCRSRYVVALALGLAVLAKGPVGALLPGLAMGIFLVHRKRWRDLRALYSPGPAAIVVIVGGAWYLGGYFAGERALLARQLGSENLGRFFGGLGSMPPWYYVEPLLLESLPFSLLVPFAVYWALRRASGGGGTRERGDTRDFVPEVLAVFWIVTVLFFSLSAYKRRTYLLPLWPSAAVLTVWWLEQMAFDRRGKMLRGAVAALCPVLAVINLVYIQVNRTWACEREPFREPAAAIARIVPRGDPLSYAGPGGVPIQLVFYLDRSITPVSRSASDLPSGYLLVGTGGSELTEPLLTLRVGKSTLALVRHEAVPGP